MKFLIANKKWICENENFENLHKDVLIELFKNS